MLIKHHKGFDYKAHWNASPLLHTHKERPKMVSCTDKHDRVGKNRLKQIHKRVKYLAEECGYKEREKPTYKIHQLCSDCARKIKYHDRYLLDVAAKHRACILDAVDCLGYVEPRTNSLLPGG